MTNNSIIYRVSVLIASMAASIIFLSAGTRRVFPEEIFFSRDVAALSANCIVSSTSSICSSLCCWCLVCIGCIVCICCCWLADCPESGRFVRFADVANGKSIVDGTNGFVQALVVGCGADTTFTGSGFLFCLDFGIEFLVVCFG